MFWFRAPEGLGKAWQREQRAGLNPIASARGKQRERENQKWDKAVKPDCPFPGSYFLY